MDNAMNTAGMLIPRERVSSKGERKRRQIAEKERKLSLLDLLDHRHLALENDFSAERPDMAADAIQLAECVGRMEEAARGGRLV